MDQNVISSYLVKLGYGVDQPSLQKFQGSLREAYRSVESGTFGIVRNFAAVQSTIVGTFAAVGASAVGLADKVAQTDLQYQLFGLHMYITADQARKLKIATDALGASLEDVVWNQELRKRAGVLFGDEDRMTGELGPGFEEQMRKIRDVRFEFTRMQVELKFLGMKVVQDFLKSLGVGPDELLTKLQHFNDWIIQNIPNLSKQFVHWFLPVLKDTKNVLGDTVDLAKEAGIAFANLIGLISGDHELEGVSFSFKKIAGAIQEAIHMLALFADAVTDTEKILLHLFDAVTLGLSGHFSQAAAEIKQAIGLIGPGTGAILGAASVAPVSTLIGGMLGAPAGPIGILAGSALGSFLLPAAGAGVGAGLGYGARAIFGGSSGTGDSAAGDIQQAIIAAATRMGVDPRLALAVAKVESGFRQYDSAGNLLMARGPNSHAMGIFQLQPGTAQMMGVDARNPYGNIQGGIGYLHDLLLRYHGDAQSALQHYYGSRDYGLNADYAAKVLRVEAGLHIENLLVSVPSGDSAQVKQSVLSAVEEAQIKQTQRNLAEFQSLGWSYGG